MNMNASQETSRSHHLLRALFLKLLFLLAVTGNTRAICTERERLALLSFKKGLVDFDDTLPSWKYTNLDCCRWRGVTCDNQTAHIINSSNGLSTWVLLWGEIGSSLLELQYLNHLDLCYNSFPDILDFIGSLKELSYLDLSSNCFTRIPESIGSVAKLEYLNLSSNILNGTIPY
ncbi:hypothetical protein SLA2020_412130 [Shorea laevis]